MYEASKDISLYDSFVWFWLAAHVLKVAPIIFELTWNSQCKIKQPTNAVAMRLQEMCKYMRAEVLKPDQESQAIQIIVGAGLEREELRDEIYVQCMRQATNNPSGEATERVWLLLCLIVVAFHPSKNLYKVSSSF